MTPLETKKAGERFNQKFRAETPKVSDGEIRGLIRKYPPPPNVEKIKDKINERKLTDAHEGHHNMFG